MTCKQRVLLVVIGVVVYQKVKKCHTTQTAARSLSFSWSSGKMDREY